MRTKRKLGKLATPAAIMALLLFWEFAVRVTGAAAFILPSPVLVFSTLVANWALLAEHSAITMLEMLAGLAAGGIAGVATAIAMARSGVARRLLLPAIITTQTLPVFAIAPLLVIWFGFGAGSKVIMAALIIYFPIASSFHDGLASVDRQWLDLGRSWGASRRQILFGIQIPAALPSLASGARIAATLAPIGAIVGEWAGASAGLGYIMLQANARMQTDLVFASLIILAVMALVLRQLVASAADRLVFWNTGTA